MHRFDRFAALHVDPLWQARRIDGGQRSTGGPGGGYCTPPGRQHGWWRGQIGRAACRGRGENSVGGGSFKKKKKRIDKSGRCYRWEKQLTVKFYIDVPIPIAPRQSRLDWRILKTTAKTY